MRDFIPVIDQHRPSVKVGKVHSFGYLRDAFRDWAESGMHADEAILIDEEEKPLSWLIGSLWNCSDILPTDCCKQLGIGRGSTYAQAVRGL